MKKVVLLLAVCAVLPLSAADKGYQIMRSILRRNTIKSMQADMQLVLISSTGEQRVRKIKFYSKTDPRTDLSRMLMRFIYPRDVVGTGFLTIENADRPDDRFLYLPALRRVKKIASSGRGGNFMSSDFTYYDMGAPKLEDWKYHLLREETRDGKRAWVIEARPSSRQVLEDTGYSKYINWVNQADSSVFYTEYYDKSGELKKVLIVKQFQKIHGTPFATDMVMHDVQINHKSRMTFENLKVDVPIPDKFFTPRFLQRGR